MQRRKQKKQEEPQEVKLELGPKDLDVLRIPLVQADESVDEASIVHALQFLTAEERIALVNDLYRVLKPGAKCQLVVPNWAAQKAYADLRVQWPPVAEGWFLCLSADHRKNDPFPDERYTCDFAATWGYGLHQSIISRNHEYQSHAVQFWKEAAQDIAATLIKK